MYFEGEYLDGKKWNGKIYNLEDNKISEIKNGTIEYIKEYDIEGDLKYEGKYINGIKSGYGKLYEKIKYRGNILIFEGEFLDGKIWNGKGRYYSEEGIEFEGTYLNGRRWNGYYSEYDEYGDIIDSGKYINGKFKSDKQAEEEEESE